LTKRSRSSGATPQHSEISCPNDLPLPATLTDPSITLTYALAVRATRKRNPVAKRPSNFKRFRLAGSRIAERDYSLFSGLFFYLRIPRADSQSRQDTRERRRRNTPSGRPTLLALWRPFRPTGRMSPAIETRRASTDSSAGTVSFLAKGNRSPRWLP
jgi:hypothetical protein